MLFSWNIYVCGFGCFFFALLSSSSKPSAACFCYYQQLELDYKTSHAWQLSTHIYSMRYVDYVYSQVKIYPHESTAKKLCGVLLISFA